LEAVEREVARLVPDAALARDLTARMSCAIDGCFQMASDSAIRRIVSRVSPEIPTWTGLGTDSSVLTGSSVRARLRIAEDGTVTVQNVEGGFAGVNASIRNAFPGVSASIRTAVEQWRFEPVVIGGEGRCVETTLFFLVGGE
jgi:hypothetical protein